MGLTNFKIKTAAIGNRHHDGRGLCLTLSARGRGKWTMRYMINRKAKEIGLINNVVKKEDLSVEVKELAEKIASKSSITVSIGKKAFYAQAEMNLSEAYKYTSQVMKDNLLNDDAKEGIDAFIEKRSPNWKDK